MPHSIPALFKAILGGPNVTEFLHGLSAIDAEGLIVMLPLVFAFLLFSIALQAMDRPFEPWQAQFDGEDNQSE